MIPKLYNILYTIRFEECMLVDQFLQLVPTRTNKIMGRVVVRGLFSVPL